MYEGGLEPGQTLALLLGASSFRRAPKLAQGRAFYNSAQDFYEYLTRSYGLNLPSENVIWLFDDSRSPSDQLQDVRDFLENRSLTLKNEGLQPQDLIVYYVGHGLFSGSDHAYCLAVRATDERNEGLTSIRAGDLASIIKTSARFLRKFLILDCCFSAAAYKEFQSGPLRASRVKLLDELPQRGTALLCSASAQDPSLAPEGLSRTMFSEGLINALRQGHRFLGPRLSLSELGDLVITNVREAYPNDWVRPEVHSPDQREGDVASVPLFPNAAYLTQKAAADEEVRRQQAEAEAAQKAAAEEEVRRQQAEAEAAQKAAAEEEVRRQQAEAEAAQKAAADEEVRRQQAEAEAAQKAAADEEVRRQQAEAEAAQKAAADEEVRRQQAEAEAAQKAAADEEVRRQQAEAEAAQKAAADEEVRRQQAEAEAAQKAAADEEVRRQQAEAEAAQKAAAEEEVRRQQAEAEAAQKAAAEEEVDAEEQERLVLSGDSRPKRQYRAAIGNVETIPRTGRDPSNRAYGRLAAVFRLFRKFPRVTIVGLIMVAIVCCAFVIVVRFISRSISSYHSFKSITFSTPLSGWIVGDDNVVQHTENGGNTWTRQVLGTESDLHRSVVFINANAGWILGTLGNLYQTEDGGVTWKTQISIPGSLQSLVFVTATSGWAVGEKGEIQHTEDGGKTWKAQNGGTEKDLTSVAFITPQGGWVTGVSGTILHTSDGGTTWSKQNSNTTDDLNSIAFATPESGWTVGANGTILHTDDGGSTWLKQTNSANTEINSVMSTTAKSAWVVGFHGTILHTEDGGMTWVQKHKDPDGSPGNRDNRDFSVLYGIAFRTPLSGWAVGTAYHLDQYHLLILQTEDGGNTWTQQSVSGQSSPLAAPEAAAPVFTPTGGTYPEPRPVTITDATPQSTIYYTVGGSSPTKSSQVYSQPLDALPSGAVIRAKATAKGHKPSPEVTSVYIWSKAAKPVATPPTSVTYDRYRKAADSGDPAAMTILGDMYAKGLGGLQKDDAQAVNWYRKAADSGETAAMTNLGWMYEGGLGGLPKDKVQAVNWYRKAADGGNAAGMRHLAVMYENGFGGLPEDLTLAMSWYRRAADGGDEFAKDRLKPKKKGDYPL